jgi:single-strand DNA-binding protein
MINKVTLVGHLGKDPEVKHLENGASVARMVLATNENYKDKEGNWQSITDWHTVIAWRALADVAERQLKKGSMVYLEGRLKTRSYKDNAGVDKYTTEVDCTMLRSLDKKDKNEVPMPSERTDYSNTSSKSEPPSSASDGSQDMPEDDLPF